MHIPVVNPGSGPLQLIAQRAVVRVILSQNNELSQVARHPNIYPLTGPNGRTKNAVHP